MDANRMDPAAGHSVCVGHNRISGLRDKLRREVRTWRESGRERQLRDPQGSWSAFRESARGLIDDPLKTQRCVVRPSDLGLYAILAMQSDLDGSSLEQFFFATSL